MLWREVIKRSFLALIYVAAVVGTVFAQPQQQASDDKDQEAAVETLSHYLQLRLCDAPWNEYSKYITWPDEPGWDCQWVISTYNRGPAKKEGDKVIVPVTSRRLGLFCSNITFEPNPKEVTVNYELVMRPSGWKVNTGPDYPEVRAEVLIRRLRSLAKDKHRISEYRIKAEAMARKVEGALKAQEPLSFVPSSMDVDEANDIAKELSLGFFNFSENNKDNKLVLYAKPRHQDIEMTIYNIIEKPQQSLIIDILAGIHHQRRTKPITVEFYRQENMINDSTGSRRGEEDLLRTVRIPIKRWQ